MRPICSCAILGLQHQSFARRDGRDTPSPCLVVKGGGGGANALGRAQDYFWRDSIGRTCNVYKVCPAHEGLYPIFSSGGGGGIQGSVHPHVFGNRKGYCTFGCGARR